MQMLMGILDSPLFYLSNNGPNNPIWKISNFVKFSGNATPFPSIINIYYAIKTEGLAINKVMEIKN
jgi:hypothetical protein